MGFRVYAPSGGNKSSTIDVFSEIYVFSSEICELLVKYIGYTKDLGIHRTWVYIYTLYIGTTLTINKTVKLNL